MSESFPQDCWLYKPGHKTHFTQLNVMRDKERFPAEVELIDLETLEIKYNGQAVQLRVMMQSGCISIAYMRSRMRLV